MDDTKIEQQLDCLRERVKKLEAAAGIAAAPNVEECNCGEMSVSSGITRRIDYSGQVDEGALHLETKAPLAVIARGRATVDYSTNDNGFLRCCYNAWRNSSNMAVLLHSNTAGAVANVRTGPESFSIICGHGSPGLIICGTGQVVDGIDKYIAASNESTWRPLLSGGVVGAQLTLFGCEVASGAAGADLLRRVAACVRKPVGAWTGLVWCGSGRTWGTGNFVVVRPGDRLNIVESPAMFDEHPVHKMHTLRLASHEGHEEVKVDQIKSVHFTPVGSLPTTQAVVHVAGKEAISVLETVDFDNPFVTEDKPGSILLGLLTVTYESNKVERVRAFRVLGYSLLQDTCFQDTYYYASTRLRDFLLKDSKR